MGIAGENVFTYGTGTHPDFEAINSTGAATQDGTEIIAEGWNNFILGPWQALFNWAGITPDGVTESQGASQWLESLRKGHGIGPGKGIRWFLANDPSVTGDRVLLLSGQTVLIASYPELVSACYVGDGNNATAPYFYKSTDSGGATRSTSGTYFTLPESRDYVFPNGPRTTSAFWHTVDGYGSTNTKIQKFTTEVVASDDVVVTVDNSTTLGMSVTANMLCDVTVTYTGSFNSVGYLGISKNSTELTTAISGITVADRLCANDHPVSEITSVSVRVRLTAGDVLRPHASGAIDSPRPDWGSFHVFAQESPRENTDTIIGITY